MLWTASLISGKTSLEMQTSRLGACAPQWLAVAYLGVIGSAGAFILWVFALSRTSPTKTAVTITVNPVFASIVGALAIGEGIGLNLIAGLAAVAVGIWIATTAAR
jgi:drug/metabolite transporter (DMT)-like permease